MAGGLGANFVVFSLLDALVIEPLAAPHPEQIVQFVLLRANNIPETEFVELYGRLLQQRARSFGAVFASGDADQQLEWGDRAQTVLTQQVSTNFVQALGIRLALGAPFAEDDEHEGRYPVVLGYGRWQSAFGGRRDVLGQTIRLRGQPFTITGVMPREFHGMNVDAAADAYVPAWSIRRWVKGPVTLGPPVSLYARLLPGVSIEQARAEFETLYPGLVETEIQVQGHNEDSARRILADARARKPWLEPLSGGSSALRKQFALALQVMMGAAGLLLLLVCANVSGLLLARSEARNREIAVRLSLGATRGQVAALVLRESVLLAGAGVLLAAAFARWGGPAMIRFLPGRHPVAIAPGVSWRVFAFVAAVSALAMLLASLVPAARILRSDSTARSDLTALMSRAGSRFRHSRATAGFVALQVMLATVLTAGGVAMVLTLHRLRSADPGFAREHMLVLEVGTRASGLRPGEADTFAKLGQVREMPGVQDASLASVRLMMGLGLKNTVAPEGVATTASDLLNASTNTITANHLRNMGMRLIAGRSLEDRDRALKPRPAVVTTSFARKFFPGREALGARFGTGVNKVAGPDYEIVGIAADTKFRTMREEAPPTFFVVARDNEFTYGFSVFVRTRGDSAAVADGLRALWSSGGYNISHFATLDGDIESSLWRERLLAWISGVFAGLSALLAGAGLYGMLAQTVRRRTREIGIRMALGATAGRILKLVGRDIGLSVLPGLAAGVAAYLAVSSRIAPLLYSTQPGSAGLVVAGVVFVAAIAVIAGSVPARRAVNVAPAEALRAE